MLEPEEVVLIRFKLPVGPSVNEMYVKAHKNSRFGTKAPSPQFRAWKKDAAKTLSEQWIDQGKPIPDKPWGIRMMFGINHRSDIFNREKAITDLIVGTLSGWPDDAWINHGTVERGGEAGFCAIECYSIR